jgi:serine protease Do
MFFILLVLLNLSQASDKVIVPSRLEVPFIAVFSGVKIKHEQAYFQSATLVREGNSRDESQNWSLSSNHKTVSYSLDFYEKVKTLTSAVVETQMGSSYGTAFHIGDGLFLTYHHVLSSSRANLTQCDGLTVYSPLTKARYACESVKFCNKDADYCLIQMTHYKSWFKEGPSPRELPSLSLRSIQRPELEGSYAAIGNPAGDGLKYSQGRGIRPYKKMNFLFYAPVHSGNSGGPLLNMEGEVIAVVYAQGHYGIKEDSQNFAVSIDYIFSDLKEKLGPDHEAYIRFQKSIVGVE